jgi:hypothetical protein
VPQCMAITPDDDFSGMSDEELRESMQNSMVEMLDQMDLPEAAHALRSILQK